MQTTSYKVFYLLFQFTFFSLALGSILLVTSSVIALLNTDEESYSIGAYQQHEFKIDPEVTDIKSITGEVIDSHLDAQLSTVKFKTKGNL